MSLAYNRARNRTPAFRHELDQRFLKRHGRMLFLTYLRTVINGEGFCHIESQLTDERRMDVVVDFGGEQFIEALQIIEKRGEEYGEAIYLHG